MQPPLTPTSAPVSLELRRPASAPSDSRSLIAIITLNNPSQLNAMTSEGIADLISAIEYADSHPDVLITVLTGTGRFFSSGAAVGDGARQPPFPVDATSLSDPAKLSQLKAFYRPRIAGGTGLFGTLLMNHSKILVVALNGPAVGILAVAVSHADLVWAYEDSWIATPFTSLALVAEGLSSKTFVEKMGLGKAQQALLLGRKMHAPELHSSGLISVLLPVPSQPTGVDTKDKAYTRPILSTVLSELESRLLPPNANPFALLYTKKLLRDATYGSISAEEANVREVRGAETVFLSGAPQQAFADIASGKRRHKL